jgi:tetratricopeptide (TPR) repeat protein
VKRSIFNSIVLGLALSFTTVHVAHADDPPPSAADLDKAKKAFAEGKKLHEAKKLPEAIEKFKESYRLSKNPLLLYNIGLTMEEAGMEDLALMYYRRFLKEAPADATQRPTVEVSVKAIEKKLNLGGTAPTPPTGPDTSKPNPNKEPKAPVVIKPPGTYKEDSFQHQVVDSAPPGKPLDITASVPEDSGFVVTLYFRTAGEGKWTPKVMKWRYRELVARIPAPKMIGKAVQYYIEAKDSTGASIAKSAKSTSPNQVLLEAGVAARFYPDMSDDGDAKPSSAKDVAKSDTDDDPINKRRPVKKDDDIVVNPNPTTPGNGFMDAGSSKFTKVKYGTTIASGTLIAFGVLSYVQALKYASALETDSAECGAPPCRKFNTATPVDNYAQGVEKTGKRWQTFFKVGTGVGIATGVVAGYFWYKEMKAKGRGEMKVSKSAKKDETSSWIVVPAIGESTAGATAAVRF